MSKFIKSFYLLVFTGMFVVYASDLEVKIGDSFQELKNKYGLPQNVNFISHSTGEKFEVVSFKNHKAVYVFNASKAGRDCTLLTF